MQLIINQKYFSIGDKFAVTDESGKSCFMVQSSVISVTKEFYIFDLSGVELYYIKAKFSFFGKFVISRGGVEVGSIVGKFHAPFCRKFVATFGDKVYKIKGSSLAFRVKIFDDKDKKNPVATVNKKVMKIADTYVIDFDQTKLEPLNAIAAGLVIDAMFHKDH